MIFIAKILNENDFDTIRHLNGAHDIIFKWRVTIARNCLGCCGSFACWSYKTINNNYIECHVRGWILKCLTANG